MKADFIEMTPERKARFERVSAKLIDVMRAELTPLEAFAMMQMMLQVFKQKNDIRGFWVNDSEVKQ
jgi:hypothetical protein